MAGRMLSDLYDWALGDRLQRTAQAAPAQTPAPTPMPTPQPMAQPVNSDQAWVEWAAKQANRRFKAGDRSPEVLSALNALMGQRAARPQQAYGQAMDRMMQVQPSPTPMPGVNM